MIFVIALIASPACAVAETADRSRYEMLKHYCFNREFPSANQAKEEDRLDNLKLDEWIAEVEPCKKLTPPRAPANTVMTRPKGTPTKVVDRPPGAPKGEYYLCNPTTFMPDPTSTKICGPSRR